MGTRPAINSAAVCLDDFRIIPGWLFNFGSDHRDIDFELLIKHDPGLRETVLHPELVGGERGVDGRHHVVFEHFSRTQSRHGNVLLAIVGIDRRFFFERDA